MKPYLAAILLFGATFVAVAYVLQQKSEKPEPAQYQPPAASEPEQKLDKSFKFVGEPIRPSNPYLQPAVEAKKEEKPVVITQKPEKSTKADAVYGIQTKIQYYQLGRVAVSIKGMLAKPSRSGTGSITFVAKGKLDEVLGHTTIYCDARKNQDAPFSKPVWMSGEVLKRFARWEIDDVTWREESDASPLDMKILEITPTTGEIDSTDDMDFKLTTVIHNTGKHSYVEEDDLTLLALDSDGFALGAFSLTRYSLNAEKKLLIDTSHRIMIGDGIKKLVQFNQQKLYKPLFDRISHWKVIRRQVGIPISWVGD